jgi:hypothetical protein
MTNNKKPHPLALGGNRPSQAQKGRPRKAGDRYPNGKLKPQGPNARCVENRKSMGLTKLNQRMIPLDVAHANGWLSNVDYLTAIRFANLHQTAGLARSGSAMGATLEVDVPTEVSLSVTMQAKSFFAGLPDAEMVALWDRVFDRAERDPVRADETATAAMKQWKAACAAMTMQERGEVTDVCVLDSWPQWIIQRSAGKMGTTWERKRDLLISGLTKVRQALRKTSPSPPSAQPIEVKPSTPVGERQTERTVYVDSQTGEAMLEVERITRRPQRQRGGIGINARRGLDAPSE